MYRGTPGSGVTRYRDAADFLSALQPLLEESEDQNNLILGVALSRRAAEDAGFEQPAALFAHSGPIESPTGVMMMTPPFPLALVHTAGSLSRLTTEVSEALIGDELPTYGVLAAAEVADAFAAAWEQAGGGGVRKTVSERLHRADQVEQVAVREGELIVAGPDHFGMLVDWVHAFTREAVPDQPPSDPARSVGLRIEQGDYFLWEEDGVPLGMAARTRKTPNGICINSVYTPPEHRGKKVALSCVAELTRELLTENRFCVLYTDVANPTSNTLYGRIGYRPVCDYSLHWFH